LDLLQQNASPVKAAEDLKKRAKSIQEWRFDETTFARVVAIASSVTAAIVARIILNLVGWSRTVRLLRRASWQRLCCPFEGVGHVFACRHLDDETLPRNLLDSHSGPNCAHRR
jgi:hypothetical protein